MHCARLTAQLRICEPFVAFLPPPPSCSAPPTLLRACSSAPSLGGPQEMREMAEEMGMTPEEMEALMAAGGGGGGGGEPDEGMSGLDGGEL